MMRYEGYFPSRRAYEEFQLGRGWKLYEKNDNEGFSLGIWPSDYHVAAYQARGTRLRRVISDAEHDGIKPAEGDIWVERETL